MSSYELGLSIFLLVGFVTIFLVFIDTRANVERTKSDLRSEAEYRREVQDKCWEINRRVDELASELGFETPPPANPKSWKKKEKTGKPDV